MRAATLALLVGCGTGSTATDGGIDASSDVQVDVAAMNDTGTDAGIDAGDVMQKLQTLTATCNQVSTGMYATDQGGPANVPICGLTGAVFWKADMDIDCDGKQTTQCSLATDPDFQNQTAATDSLGNPLDAANLPYVVVPAKSGIWDASKAGLKLGGVILVLYNNQMEFAIYGDVGPSAIIGEASYKTASDLGIDPNPSTGGADTGVTYIAFAGAGAVVSKKEDHAAAVTLGQSLLAALVK